MEQNNCQEDCSWRTIFRDLLQLRLQRTTTIYFQWTTSSTIKFLLFPLELVWIMSVSYSLFQPVHSDVATTADERQTGSRKCWGERLHQMSTNQHERLAPETPEEIQTRLQQMSTNQHERFTESSILTFLHKIVALYNKIVVVCRVGEHQHQLAHWCSPHEVWSWTYGNGMSVPFMAGLGIYDLMGGAFTA